MMHIYPKNAYQLRETLFDKLDSFDIQYTDDQKLFSNLTVFDIESVCLLEEKFENNETTTQIGKHVRKAVSISSNLITIPIFLCNSNPRDLVDSFVDAVKEVALQSKTQMKLQFLEVGIAIRSKLTRTLESVNERRCRNQRDLEFGINVSKMITKRKMLPHNFCNYKIINWLSSKKVLDVTATY